MKGFSMNFSFVNVTQKKVKQTAYGQFRELIRNMPYFRENFSPTKDNEDEVLFPRNIQITYGSQNLDDIGLDIFGACLDELNFMKETVDRSPEKMYERYRTRILSRYLRGGKVPGLLLLVSSRKDATDMLERRIQVVEKTR